MRATRAIALAVAFAELGVLTASGPLRVVAGLALALVLPGLIVIRLARRWRLEAAEQIAYSLGLSCAIAILVGLRIAAFNVKLDTRSWAVALGLVCLAGLAATALVERRQKPAAAAPKPSGLPWLDGASAVMLGLAVLGTAAAIGIGVAMQGNHGSPFTELWALPGGAGATSVELGVRSHERRPTRYRIVVSVAGQRTRDQSITLSPGRTWISTQQLASRGQGVQVTLTKAGDRQVYRRVRLAALRAPA